MTKAKEFFKNISAKIGKNEHKRLIMSEILTAYIAENYAIEALEKAKPGTVVKYYLNSAYGRIKAINRKYMANASSGVINDWGDVTYFFDEVFEKLFDELKREYRKLYTVKQTNALMLRFSYHLYCESVVEYQRVSIEHTGLRYSITDDAAYMNIVKDINKLTEKLKIKQYTNESIKQIESKIREKMHNRYVMGRVYNRKK